MIPCDDEITRLRADLAACKGSVTAIAIRDLRAALAEAERERQSIRDTCVGLDKHNDELDKRCDDALARAERAEADLAAAREIFVMLNGSGHNLSDVQEAARAFLERTAERLSKPTAAPTPEEAKVAP